MRFRRCLMPALVLAGSLSLVSACASREPVSVTFPPRADLTVEPKPVLAPEAIESEAALDAHDIALEIWGERGWLAVARLCRFHKGLGMDVDCPPPTPPRDPG